MKTQFLIEEISEKGLELDEDLEKSWFKDLLFEQHLLEGSRFHVSLTLKKSSRAVLLSGRFTGNLNFVCSRCAEPSDIQLQQDFARVFLPAGAHDISMDMDIDMDDLDLDGSEYRGHAIDIQPVLVDEFVMMLPTYPLCSPDCKGLCPVCGQNLNLGECGCDREAEIHNSLKVKLNLV